MKRAYPVIALFLMLFLLAACGPEKPESVEVVEPTAKPADVLPTAPPADARPTVTPVSSDGYPAPGAAAPAEGYPLIAVTAVPSDYPVIDYSSLPTRNPYPAPGEYIWVVVPMGEQCEDTMTYPTMQDANLVLLGNGIATFDWRIEELMVCTACGCPTSTQYLMQIPATDLAAAEALGWQESEAPQ